MHSEFSTGDTVSVSYVSERSDNVVSRNGEVVQTPNEDGKNVFFVRTDEDQLTAVKSNEVFSVTVDVENTSENVKRVKRNTYLGKLDGISEA